MKKLLLATLVSAASIAAAHADGPTVYGKINASVDVTKSDLNTKNSISVDSNASRIGIKGSEKLTDNLNAVYGIEWGVEASSNKANNNTDAGNSTTTDLNARNRFVGLEYVGVGTIKLGRLDTNLKTLAYVNPNGGVDIFDDLVNGSLDTTQTFAGENRINNVIALESAKFDLGLGWVSANFQIIPTEKTVAKGAIGSTGVTATSSSVLLQNKDVGFYTGLAYDSNVTEVANATAAFGPGNAGSVLANTFRWVGSVDLGKAIGADGLTLNALAQQAKVTNLSGVKPKETSFLVSGVYKLPASVLDGLSLKAQFQTATTKDLGAGLKDVKIDQYGFDVDYAFSAKTKVYTFVAQRQVKNPNNPAVAANGYDTKYKYTAYGVGIEQKF
jgi:predicted porin